MEFNIKIESIKQYYSKNQKQWNICVYVTTDNCSVSLIYTAKKLNKVKQKMYRHLPKDLMEFEFEYRMKQHEFDNYFKED